jgi:hypothetical protein
VVTGGSGVNGGFFLFWLFGWISLVVRVGFSGCSGGFLWLFEWIPLKCLVGVVGRGAGGPGAQSAVASKLSFCCCAAVELCSCAAVMLL